MALRRLSGETLLDHLRARVYNGKTLGVPSVRASEHYSDSSLDTMLGVGRIINNLRMERLRSSNEALKERVRSFSKDTFYTLAPVPKALGLKQNPGYVDLELDLVLESEVTQVALDVESNEVKGMCLNTLWQMDTNVEVVDVDPLHWLNMSAIVAEEKANSAEEAAAIWRDFQLQNVFNMALKTGRGSGKLFCLYGGMGFLEPQYRSSAASYTQVLTWNESKPDSMALIFVVTNPGGREIYNSMLSEDLQEVVHVPYDHLSFHCGYKGAKRDAMPNVFQALNMNCGLTFFGTKAVQARKLK